MKFIIILHLYFANKMLRLLQFILYKKINNPHKIIVIRTGSIGDNVCAIPSLIAIKQKYPNAHIDILTNAGANNLVGLQKLLSPSVYSDIIDYYNISKKTLLKSLKKKKYDAVIQLPQADASLFSLIRDCIVFRYIAHSGFGWKFATIKYARKFQDKHFNFPNETQRLATILESNKIKVDTSMYALNITNQDKENVLNIANSKNLNVNNGFITIVVGAKRPQNRWPISNFKIVINEMAQYYPIALIGGPDDVSLTQPLLQINNVYNFCGMLTPMQSAVLLQMSKLTLSNDTGPMHLSYASGTPTIALFSNRDFAGKWFPPNTKNNFVFRAINIDCAICLSETCTNNICMQVIQPNDVINQIKLMLN